MANNMHPMPMFVIDTCSTEDNEEFNKTTTIRSSKSNFCSRSLSLPNYGKAYKDLSGVIHYSSLNRFKNFFIRSYSYPNNYISNEKFFYSQSLLTTTNYDMNLLDPHNGIHSPGGSSSRYSLYGSFFNLSESGYYPSLIKTEKNFLTHDGHPLLIINNTSKLSTNTYEDKCNDWLNQITTM